MQRISAGKFIDPKTLLCLNTKHFRLFQWPALIVPPYSVTEGNVAQLSQLKLNSNATEVMQIICVPATTSHGIGASVGEDSLVGKVPRLSDLPVTVNNIV